MIMALLQILMLSSLVLLQGHPTIAIGQRNQLPPYTLRGNNARTCPLDEDRERARNELSSNVQNILASITPTQGPPAASPCGGIGWRHVAYLNMTDQAQSCPSPWTLFTSGNKRVCFRSSSSSAGCDSVVYNNPGGEYNQVCGRITGYQYGNPHGFYPYHSQGRSIDSYYIDGISVTHGQPPRQHIWTFAAGYSEVDDLGSCPCGSPTSQATVPPYVGNNYFCETGTIPAAGFSVFYSDDPLWDGEGCGPGHSCECELNSPPWFTANLTNPTTNNIEVRNCGYQGTGSKNVGVELIELYVK